MATRVTNFDIIGFKELRICIQGFINKKDEIIIRVDGETINYEDIDYIGHNIVFKEYEETPEFSYEFLLPVIAKKIEVIIKTKKEEKVIYVKKVDVYSCVKYTLSKKIDSYATLLVSAL